MQLKIHYKKLLLDYFIILANMEQHESGDIQDISKLTEENIREQTATEIFKDLYDIDQIKQLLSEKFTEIHLLVAYPRDNTIYKEFPVIQNMLKKYEKYAENRPLNILILKRNLIMRPEIQTKFDELKAIYGDMIQEDTKEYSIIIGFFGGTT
jgi:hypothetical protein